MAPAQLKLIKAAVLLAAIAALLALRGDVPRARGGG